MVLAPAYALRASSGRLISEHGCGAWGPGPISWLQRCRARGKRARFKEVGAPSRAGLGRERMDRRPVAPTAKKLYRFSMKNPLFRITIRPEQCHGQPCIRGMRIRVTDILEMLA